MSRTHEEDSRFATQDEATLRDAVMLAVEHARSLGAEGSSASAHAGGGIRIVVRGGTAETAQRDSFQSLACTVHHGGRSGSASTIALDPSSVRQAVEEAHIIARLVQPDPFAGLADDEMLAHHTRQPPMYSPSPSSVNDLLDTALAIEAEAAACAAPEGVGVRVTEAGVTANDAVFALATSTGFCRSRSESSYGRWAMVLAQDGSGAARDFEESSHRRADRLASVPSVAAAAVRRTVAQLGARGLNNGRAPVIFSPRAAAAFVGDLVGALSGVSQYRGASFLPDSLDSQVAASHVDLIEDPFVPFGMASGAFDSEGVEASRRDVLSEGVVRGYFLASASARRLGLRSTGNADGPWNLRLTSRATGGDAASLRRTMDTGLVVSELLGGATDRVTGNWTRAISGFWVERGEIVHPVHDVTVGGRMTTMLRGISTVGSDMDRLGAITTGSILIDEMQIGGAA